MSQFWGTTDHQFDFNQGVLQNLVTSVRICKFIHREFYKNKISNLTPRSYNTRLNTDISLSHARRNLAANFVLHKDVKMYNSLPNDLKCIDDFQKFKRTVKSYLLNILL